MSFFNENLTCFSSHLIYCLWAVTLVIILRWGSSYLDSMKTWHPLIKEERNWRKDTVDIQAPAVAGQLEQGFVCPTAVHRTSCSVMVRAWNEIWMSWDHMLSVLRQVLQSFGTLACCLQNGGHNILNWKKHYKHIHVTGSRDCMNAFIFNQGFNH